jgi:hypothetical protein
LHRYTAPASGRVIRDDHAGLQLAQKTGLLFGLAERSGGVDGHIGVEALANGGDGRERRADFEGDAREDQLLATGRGDGLATLGSSNALTDERSMIGTPRSASSSPVE